MKIYVLTHYWDNGEKYEDYREYESSSYYSTLKLVAEAYWNETRDYEGSFTLFSVELDTQKKVTLIESEWVPCTSSMQLLWEQEHSQKSSDDPYGIDYDYNCDFLYYWRYPGCLEEKETEDFVVNEWLTHKGENYAVFKSLEEDKDFDALLSILAYKDRN